MVVTSNVAARNFSAALDLDPIIRNKKNEEKQLDRKIDYFSKFLGW